MTNKAKKIYYNKLIRDKVPNTIKNRGFRCKTSKLSLKRFKRELLKKVGEEASSLPKLKSKKEIANELADIMAVIDELKKTYQISESLIKSEIKNNNRKKGGFKKRLFLFWSQDYKYRTNEKRYLKK